MGKKVKLGKSRKDKFYQLAKESGYRSRAAFKLLQLNRKYSLLEKSRVCIDLCAAPGGWLQVAATHMPLSSIIIGVDLAPIKSIANVITHQEDITTEKCRAVLKKDLNDRKADIVLHDGAPNVGKNWLHDAYQQNMLVLQSFKLASEFLRKGGHFITKVFRSKDYYSIIWVFQQFFKKVEATKPQASRNESAEIFVVCQNYSAPEKIDPKFFDIKYVFSDVDNQNESKKSVNDLFKNDMNQRHRGGYADGDLTLYHKLLASEFINRDNFVELLANSNEVVLDKDEYAKHPATTKEIKECLKDIKLLGKNEIKDLLKWRLKLKEDFKKEKPQQTQNVNSKGVDELLEEINGKKTAKKRKLEEVENVEDEEQETNADEELENELKDALFSEKKEDKKKKKKLQKEKKKQREKIELKMELPNDTIDFNLQGDNEIFSLSKIKTKKQLMDLQKSLPGLEVSDEEEIDGELQTRRQKKKIKFTDEDKDDFYASIENGNKASDNENELEASDNEEDEAANENLNEDLDEDENPLLTDLVDGTREEKKKKSTNLWFNKEAFDFLRDDGEEDENAELLKYIEAEEKHKEENFEKNAKKKKKKTEEKKEDEVKNENKEEENGEEDNESDTDSEEDDDDNFDTLRKDKNKKQEKNSKSGFEEVPQIKLSPEELALGEVMVNSKKSKSELIDESYNRYSTFDDEDKLPEWFVEDEEKNFKKLPHIPSNITSKYKKKYEEINARPIKKVVEAQSRKKRRMSKKLDRARKKAEVISDNMDMTDKERSREIKAVYKRAGLLSKKKLEVKYVVSKKGQRGGKPGKGAKGPYKLVDKRLKKDKSHQKSLKGKGAKPRGGKPKGRAPKNK